MERLGEMKIIPGIYRHFKGKLYFVSGVGRDSEDEQKEFVVYYPLYESESKIRTRGVENFLEEVQREGYTGPRFVRVLEWHFANILPGLRLRDVQTFYEATIFTIKCVKDEFNALHVDLESATGKKRSLPIEYFKTPTSHCEFV